MGASDPIRAWLEGEPVWRALVALLRREATPSYLVGGSVRDALLGRPGCDLDVVVAGDALALGRRLADRAGGAYMPLDAERNVARIIYKTDAAVLHCDLAGLRAADILGDLWDRDLTINAMALPLQGDAFALLDPTGGYADLRAGLIRMVTPASFANDPVRVLRALRLGAALGFALTPETEAALAPHAPALARVSPERLRDELCQMIGLPNGALALARAAACGALAVALPELTDPAVARKAVALVAALEAPDAWTALPDRPPAAHWTDELSFGRSRWLACKWAALLAGVGAEAPVVAAAQRLKFSAREARYLADAVWACGAVLGWDLAPAPEALAIYRYFRRAGEAGVAGALMALAWQRAAGAEVGAQARHAQTLWRAWFERRATAVDPPALISGDQLMAALGLAPGPAVGRLLEAVREAQVQGLVGASDEALALARRLLTAGEGASA
ncbi:MAG: hypothetical protein V1772_12010 [Chloroflexota bacterium]